MGFLGVMKSAHRLSGLAPSKYRYLGTLLFPTHGLWLFCPRLPSLLCLLSLRASPPPPSSCRQSNPVQCVRRLDWLDSPARWSPVLCTAATSRRRLLPYDKSSNTPRATPAKLHRASQLPPILTLPPVCWSSKTLRRPLLPLFLPSKSTTHAPNHNTRCHSVQVPTQTQQCSQLFTVPYPFALFSFGLGLWPARSCPAALRRGDWDVSRSTRTAPHQHHRTAAGALSAPLLWGPIHPSFSFVSCPPLFLSFNLFSTLTLSTQTTLPSLVFGRNTWIPPHPTSSRLDSTTRTVISPFFDEPQPCKPSPDCVCLLLRLSLTRTSRPLENFSSRRTATQTRDVFGDICWAQSDCWRLDQPLCFAIRRLRSALQASFDALVESCSRLR
ncbi:hypothetical protein CSUB01_01540 [Colletotrichum sublineola]|uniref:Uncharacterized protein n=1 Tax=Colletotrichum sublineola TaxID=1173701 RepID=A0A066XEL7_COLSU|nr:hypothetical protein CSUB01_01540 [Colletotrichum sublineola]